MSPTPDAASALALPQATPSKPPERFGAWLARERELRGMTLVQISEKTRIGVSNLKALEQEEPKQLPARVFVLGYIRAYAQAIGMSPDEAVLRYEEETQRLRPPAEEDERAHRGKGRWRVVLAVVAVAAAAVAAVLWRMHR
jgi:cytoskeletal protein RodZ